MSDNKHAEGKLEALSVKFAELEAKIQYLTDRQAIVDVLGRYTRGVNRCDLELLTSVFWPDAQIIAGVYSGQRDEFITFWKEKRDLTGLSAQGHHTTNETIDIADNVAHVESYLISLWRPPTDDKAGKIVAARYIDRLDRRDGEWRIAVREFIPHFIGDVKSTFSASGGTYPPSCLGARDKTDPSYRRPHTPRPTECLWR